MRLIVAAVALVAVGTLAYIGYFARLPRPVFTAANISQFDQSAAAQVPPAPPEVDFDPAEKAAAQNNPDRHGKQFFAVGGTGKTGPRIAEGIIDPLYPNPGESQRLRVKVLDSAPVTGVTAEIMTDSGAVSYPLIREKGTDLAAIWSGAWNFKDTYEKAYVITLRAQSGRGETKVDITLK